MPIAGNKDDASDFDERRLEWFRRGRSRRRRGLLFTSAGLGAVAVRRGTRSDVGGADDTKPGSHWLDFARQSTVKQIGWKDLGLIEVCQRCETVELWFDPDPNHQLQLIWLLDYFHPHPEIVARLRLRLVDFDLITARAEELGRWKFPDVEVTSDELETASLAWQAYRAATPRPASICSARI